MRQNTTRSALLSVAHYGRSQNLLADTASRSFNKFHHDKAQRRPSHSDLQFLTSFDSVCSLSEFKQMPLWQAVTPAGETSSLVISTLRGIKLPLQRWTVPLVPPQLLTLDILVPEIQLQHVPRRNAQGTACPRAHGFRCPSPCWRFW